MTPLEVRCQIYANDALQRLDYCTCAAQVLFVRKLLEPKIAELIATMGEPQSEHEIRPFARRAAHITLGVINANRRFLHRPGASAAVDRESDRARTLIGEHCSAARPEDVSS